MRHSSSYVGEDTRVPTTKVSYRMQFVNISIRQSIVNV